MLGHWAELSDATTHAATRLGTMSMQKCALCQQSTGVNGKSLIDDVAQCVEVLKLCDGTEAP
jgi:hypothetical protein